MAFWIRLIYERNVYVIDLDRVAAFCQISKGRISFGLPDGETTIVVHRQTDPESYLALLDYVESRTGHRLEE
ncbi:MAG: hypothetical protein HC780_14110 [Leptolyngbyaceae cyanobacterium CSU_1_3]|nr:hypothetical protein [Leptolyngbyaceae cyanobacterium CSU_1_3]